MYAVAFKLVDLHYESQFHVCEGEASRQRSRNYVCCSFQASRLVRGSSMSVREKLADKRSATMYAVAFKLVDLHCERQFHVCEGGASRQAESQLCML